MPRQIGYVFLGVIALFSLSSGALIAQEVSTSTATTTAFLPTEVSVPQIAVGYGNYVNGIPTTYTFPDGTVKDLSLPVDTSVEDSTTLSSEPEIPKAFERVTFTVENFNTNLEEDRIVWVINGKTVQDSIGGDSIVILMGNIGETTDIRVTVESRSLGKSWSKNLSLTPGDVAVLWEANTYIPPFYKGKPLPSYKSTIKLVPFPSLIVNRRTLSPDNLLYQWKRDFRNIKGLSGYGKRFSVLETNGSSQEELQLLVSDPVSGAMAQRNVSITIIDPELLLYASTPLQGVRYERALRGGLNLGEQEISIHAAPYYFSNEELSNNTAPVAFTKNRQSLPSTYWTAFLPRSAKSETFRIEASVDNPRRVLQSARASVDISTQINTP